MLWNGSAVHASRATGISPKFHAFVKRTVGVLKAKSWDVEDLECVVDRVEPDAGPK